MLGNTFGMLVLQDFEAVTPNVSIHNAGHECFN